MIKVILGTENIFYDVKDGLIIVAVLKDDDLFVRSYDAEKYTIKEAIQKTLKYFERGCENE